MNNHHLEWSGDVARTKRIASNTLVLFMRMVVVMLINLYAVRVLLLSLGSTDYGIFSSVAGVVLISTFLNATLAISIQRFYSYAMGKNDTLRLREIFSASMNIIILICLIIFILFETLGIWFMNTQLVIPEERLHAANWAFQFSLVSFIMTLLQLPFTAALFAHEDMRTYTLVSVTDCILRLLVAALVGMVTIDGLVFYGGGLMIVAVIVLFIYASVCRIRYTECHYAHVSNKSLYRELLSFSGWTMYSSVAAVGTTHGNVLLLNIFFGPVTTASYAIVLQILNAFQALGNSIVLAFRPIMVKSYAQKDYSILNKLFMASNKLLLYLLLCVAITLSLEMRTVMNWWLGDVSEETILFARLILIYTVIINMHNPVSTIVQSTGKIKNYCLWVESIMIMCLPCSWLIFKIGASSHYAIITMIVLAVIAHMVRLFWLHKVYTPFLFSTYLFSIILPAAAIAVMVMAMAFLVHHTVEGRLIRFLAVGVSTLTMSLVPAYLFGLSSEERALFNNMVLKTLKR